MSIPTPGQRGERELIRRLASFLPLPTALRSQVAIPFGDDMAELPNGGDRLLWTTDMLMDGVDFDSREQSWEAIGRKAMAVNLSDCAAMAVRPTAALCAVALANPLSMEDALELHRGAHQLGATFGCPIVGGDTNSWDQPTVIAITVAGRPEPGLAPVRRDGAKAGDRIFLTGQVGGSILGRHLTFIPRIEAAFAIAKSLRPHAMIDISDGLALDLSRILEASNCGAELDRAAVEQAIHPDARVLETRDGVAALEHALHDGEDFELIVVVPPHVLATGIALAVVRELGLVEIGRIIATPGLWMVENGSRRPVEARGWEHFR